MHQTFLIHYDNTQGIFPGGPKVRTLLSLPGPERNPWSGSCQHPVHQKQIGLTEGSEGVRGHGGGQGPHYLDFGAPLSVSARPPGTPNSLPSHTPLPGAASSVCRDLSGAASAAVWVRLDPHRGRGKPSAPPDA